MRRLNVNKPGGGAWGKIFGRWLAENGFDQIDKGVRSRLMSCMDNQTSIEAWRATLSLTERLQLNHPILCGENIRLLSETGKGC
jgi:hypothetical protein